jgi:tRNA(fMet)-specific endonuclease VapC
MIYLIDTDVVIDHLNADPATVQLLEPLTVAGIAISIVGFMETYQGIFRNPNPAAVQEEFDDFLDGVPVIPLAEDIARRCAQLREDLKQQGKRVRSRALDLITAATALHYNLTLVTRNTADYDDIPGLTLY